jgi:transposase-like protein
MLTVVPGDGSGEEAAKDASPSLTDEIVREGARRMLAEALRAEAGAYITAHADGREASGRRLVVRNGYHQPREVLTIDDAEELLAFYDYPAEHWVHLRTTNPIEPAFATVRHRTKITKGPGSRAAGLAMAFKLIESAQARWRAVNAPRLVALVRDGARFERGVLVERHDQAAA